MVDPVLATEFARGESLPLGDPPPDRGTQEPGFGSGVDGQFGGDLVGEVFAAGVALRRRLDPPAQAVDPAVLLDELGYQVLFGHHDAASRSLLIVPTPPGACGGTASGECAETLYEAAARA
ncbi:hypothetical protein [Yinghuangia soli]|uniref:Uncharacterized protein n=1 Tax=Yinghuangia soli TaxID=2908204 RepID=A0AA41PWW2_9ACTN|nr:hypothetical protein [Yinghuangia soli]MCF2527201.1 hypothetical protein [Yinghuangia soli]